MDDDPEIERLMRELQSPKIIARSSRSGMTATERRARRGGPLYWIARRPRRFWIIMAVVLPVLYVASFGPACWWFHRSGWGGIGGYEQIRIAPKFYWPIGWTAKHSPMPIQRAIFWYARVGGGGEYIYIPINSAGHIDGHSS